MATFGRNLVQAFGIASCVCSVLCTLVFAAPATSGDMTVRGILQHVVGPGGETTGLAILLDAGIKIDGAELNQLEIESDNVDKLIDKYVQASGTVVYHTGVERGKWPVLKVSELKQLRPDGKAESNLGQRTVSLSIRTGGDSLDRYRWSAFKDRS